MMMMRRRVRRSQGGVDSKDDSNHMRITVRERVSVQINRLKGLKTEDGSRQR
jgi:hypothetical protein